MQVLMRISGFLISLCLLSYLAQAQDTEYYLPKRERDWVPSHLFLSTDLIGLTRLSNPGNIYTSYQAKIDFDSYFLVVDAGYSKVKLSESLFDYSSQGMFYRVGPQVDFLPYSKDWNNLFFGLMYGWSAYQDEIDHRSATSKWPESNLSLQNNDLRAQWAEANFGLSAHIVGPLFMGYVLRFKFARTLDDYDELYPWEIPGYGRADMTGRFEFNYHITYRIGFREKPLPLRPKKVRKEAPQTEY